MTYDLFNQPKEPHEYIAPTEPHYRSQMGRVLAFMRSGYTLTQRDAIHRFNCYRLAAVVFSLKAMGHDIRTTMEGKSGGPRWARYRLVKKHGQA